MRSLRNLMVHEYINSTALLTDAVNQANALLGELQQALEALLADMQARA